MKPYYTILMGLVCLLFALQASATKGHKKKRRQPTCNSEAYSSEVLKETQISEKCVEYEIKVSYDGSRVYGLSHYSIAIPCGEVTNYSNSENWKMVFGKDRKTGVYGLKVDDISGFGDGKAESFIVKFTWCTTGSCETELGVVAYKYGQCVSYDTLENDSDPEPPQSCSTLSASLQKKNATCFTGNDGELQVIISEGQEPFVYAWSNGATTATAQNLGAGTYAVTIQDANGNVLTLHEEVTSDPPIVITETVVNPACSGVSSGSIDLTVTGGSAPYTFAWSNGSTDQNISGLASGLHTVTVTDATGCSTQKSFMLTNGAVLTAGSSLRHPSCTQTNGSIDITTFGGVAPYTYLWSTGATTEDLQTLGAGTYTLKITDAAGCSTERSYTLRVNNTLLVTPQVTPTSCEGDDSGAIDLTIVGEAPYTIQWLDGPTTEDRSGLTAGNYKVTVSDASGCATTLNISVFKKQLQVSSIVSQPTCSGDLGSITVTPTGEPPYTYTWSNGETGNTIEGLVNGIYSVTITDGSGCSRSLFFAIQTPTPIEVTSAVSNTSCGSEGSFAIDLSVMGGKFPYTYLWSNGATTQDVSGLNTGTYTVEIRDGFGCVVEREFTVEPVTVSWSCLINPVVAPVVCKSAGNILATGVAGATTYEWTVSSTDNSWSITSGAADSAAIYTAGNPGTSGTFTLTITKDGCTRTCTYTVDSGCVERDNTGGGDPTSGEPCAPQPTPPPVVVVPEPEEPAEEENTHGCKAKVVKIYPNPFREKVNFEWTSKTDDHVRLEVFNSRGKRLAVVYEGPVKKGKNYSYDWSAHGCGNDRFYYYKYTTSKSVDNGKLVRK